jgi:hypothetical protein
MKPTVNYIQVNTCLTHFLFKTIWNMEMLYQHFFNFAWKTIILKWILGKLGMRMWIGFAWLMLGSGDRLLCPLNCTFSSLKMQKMLLAECTTDFSRRILLH